MYLRCYFESNPAWNGNSRALFQNNSNHRPANTKRKICSRRRALNCLKLACQRNAPTEAIAIRTIQNGQMFFTTPNVRSAPAVELPGLGVLAAEASAA